MGNYSFKVQDVDERFDARVSELKIGNKTVLTPTKTLNIKGTGLIKENFIRIDTKMIENIDNPQCALKGLSSKYDNDSLNAVIPEYTDTSVSDKQLSMVESMIHPQTDILVTPKWTGILRTKDETVSEKYWNLTKIYIEECRIMNGKPIMGTIPLNLPMASIDDLIDRYTDADVCFFLLDYGSAGARNKAGYVRNIVKKLEKDGFLDESLLYSTNMRKTHDFKDFKPADNLLTYTEGIDVIGNYHMNARGNDDGKFKKFNPEGWIYDLRDTYPGYKYYNETNNDHVMINNELDKVRNAVIENKTSYDIVKNKTGSKEYILDYSQTTIDKPGSGWKNSFGFR